MKRRPLRLYVKLHGLKWALVRNQSGQDLVEYGLVVSLIALAATAGMGVVARSISTAFTHIGSKLSTFTS